MAADETHGVWTSLVLLERFRAGDESAAEAIFARYFGRLTLLARSRLSARLARRTDPEDIVQSVYRSFFVGAREGRYELERGGDLWRLLASITRHKLLRQVRHQGADRRSIDLECPLDRIDEGRCLGREQDPTPEEALALSDELEWVFADLDAFGRRVLELRLQGLQIAAIAGDTGRAERSVRRALSRIRGLLAERFEFMGEEDRVRGQRGDRSSREALLSPVPERPDNVPSRSIGIDREPLRPEPGPTPGPRTRSSSPAGPGVDDPGMPLLSDRSFLLRRLIGAGRIGKVYRAWQPGAGREVAVKYLRKTLLQDSRVVERFIGEARTVAGLSHPQIVGTQGLGRTRGGAYFIVMDLVHGPDLARLGEIRSIAVAEAMRWVSDACCAVEHAHERGVIHCDLKPANLLLDADGGIRVADFGLARSLAGHTHCAAEVEGTAPFMAPEQVARCWGPIDQRTDVYGLGAVLFALLTGRPPHRGRRLPDILADVVSAATVIPAASLRPDLPEALGELCRRCLCKAPEGRYQTVREVRSALAALIGNGCDEARADSDG
jgi:DNA-directed RNA polymerase specialized sigma24 family protein